MSMDDSKPVPKKRGRKPKNHVDNTNIILSSNSPVQTPMAVNGETKALPKKRGRKPKGGKIVEPEQSQKGAEEPKMNVILSLKCSLKDLQSSTQIDYLEPYNSNMNGGFEPLNNEIDKNNSINNLGCNYSVMDEQSPVKDNQPNVLPEVENDETETKAIWKKLKQLEQNLNHNHTDNFKSDCFWCTCSFDNPPCYIPKCHFKDTYNVYGCFCSPECGAAFLMEENIDSSTKFERYYLLNHIYGGIYDYAKNIKPAPSPFYMLNKYYGNLSIQEYRALLNDERLFLVVDKPMTRIMPELHQTNDDHILSNKIIPSNQASNRFKRPTTKNDALAENFGLAQK